MGELGILACELDLTVMLSKDASLGKVHSSVTSLELIICINGFNLTLLMVVLVTLG